MATPEPHYRRPLNPKQLDILKLLYRFRFATSDLLTQTLQLKDKSKTNQRLKILLEQKYIGRNYEPEYRLLHKHASYHLLTNGINALKQSSATKYDPTVLHNIHGDKTASDQFIEHSLGVFRAYNQLRAQFGDSLRFFTKTQLTKFSYFPKPLPDAYIRLTIDGEEIEFFLELLQSSRPLVTSVGRINRYIAYSVEDKWEPGDSELPVILLVCENPTLQKRLAKVIPKLLKTDDADDLMVYAATQDQFANAKDKIWQSLREPTEELVSLLDM